ncbi:CHRD domain-containing protein [Nocardioides limicola]|uniref:CHRD domain-containing protein n=1 Tax=Nocardioides limicola TaxID=2803368 RepID=UPI00193C20D2|nr:CHRD domain-containing protein [Nocardioides sp. DJM-14]
MLTSIPRFFFAVLLVLGLSLTGAASASPGHYTAHLSGGEEVAPVDTRATGQTTFRLNADGTELSYRLIVANIENVTQAHIHLAPAGVNGPVVAWLYPASSPAQPIPGRSNGVLATGVITSANLVGPLAGHDLSDLIEHLEAGNAYVNVHTSQYPGGEIRGQIR